MRSLYMICGLFMFAPQVWFLFLHRPPVPLFPERVPGYKFKFYAPHRRWWLATSMRLLSFSVLSGGARLFISNLRHIDDPLQFDNWSDGALTTSTIIVSTIASVMFLAVYLRYRDWKA